MSNTYEQSEASQKLNKARLALSFLRTEVNPSVVREKYKIAYDTYSDFLRQGYTFAYYGLFSIFYNGKAVKDLAKAWEYLQKGVEAGDNACIGELATMYFIGNAEFNVVKNVQMAKQILSKQSYKDTRTLTAIGLLTENDSEHKEEFKEGLVKIYLLKLAIYKKFGGFGEDEKTQKSQIKACKKMIKYYSKYNYFAEKWAKTFRKEYLR